MVTAPCIKLSENSKLSFLVQMVFQSVGSGVFRFRSGVFQVLSQLVSVGGFRCFQVLPSVFRWRSGVLQVWARLVFFGETDFRCAHTVWTFKSLQGVKG